MRGRAPVAAHGATAADAVLQELLRPTLRDEPARRRPFRLGSQVYVAFFGGPIAAMAIALVNGRRLRIGRGGLALMVVAGLAGLGVAAGAIAALDLEALLLPGRFAGLAAYGAMWLVQRTPDRIHAFHSTDEEPNASLWIPGLLAALGGGTMMYLVLQPVADAA